MASHNMHHLDESVAAVLDSAHKQTADDSDEDSDALIAELEEAAESGDPTLSAMREQRLEQLRSEVLRSRQARDQGAGSYARLTDEKAVLDLTTTNKYAVVHFYKPDFERCRVMDGHLETLAKKHFDTRFAGINVDDAPFLVTKLKVRVLPCVISFVNGVGVDRIVGFEGLGNGDWFATRDLESRLLQSGVLVRQKVVDEDEFAQDLPLKSKTIRDGQYKKTHDDDDNDDDWD